MRASETAVVLQGCVSHGRCTAEPISWPSGYFTAGLRGVCETERERASSFRERELVREAAFEEATSKEQRETKRSYTLFSMQLYLVYIVVSDSLALWIAHPSAMSYYIASLRSRVPRDLQAGWLAGGKCTRASRTSRVLLLELPLSSWLSIIDRDISSL